MSKKIGLNIGGRRYDVNVDDTFALYLAKHMAEDFNVEGNNDLKLILQAYVSKVHKLYTLEDEMQKLLHKID
jgi:hypothetical protein